MPNIALFINSLNKGGAERVMANLADYLCERGWQVTLVTQYRRPDEYRLRHAGGDGIRRVLSDITGRELCALPLVGRPVNFFRRWKKLRGIWKKERPDIILSFIGKNNVMALSSASGLGIPVVVSVRSDPAREYADPRLRREMLRFFPRAAGVVLQTAAGKDFFPQVIAEKAVILPNPLHEQFMREPWTGEREKTIVSVGRIDENKNQKLMITSFSRLAAAFPEYRLVLYGDGPAREALEAETCRLGLAERVLFAGTTEDVAERISRASLFLLASNREGMPNALLEAMALGLPCIATDCPCGGPGELIRDHENGILVPVGDARAMEEACRELLEAPELAARMGQAAVRVRELCAPEQALARWEEYLRSVLDGSSGGQVSE
ncbi:glycosyltransferase [Lachnoclostridium sp. Marseille-P6806]|uniref:glycosyltransferase n=1 Tax=Lachnoclostridium sp. Marseille-P6806 TaxID=2364793 RepID=UPI0010320AD7|nr:glycosyltransferase [Lachnoclostridium sp. Marseille-P6806]